MKTNFIKVSRYNQMLIIIAALLVYFGSVITGGQVVYAGLSKFEPRHQNHSAVRHARHVVPTTRAMVAKWWKWFLGIPGDMHPIKGEKYCDREQSGKLWFLVSFSSNEEEIVFDRHCTVPAGKDIVIPIINAECSTLEKDPFFGEDKKALKACIKPIFTKGDTLSFKVDGKEVRYPLRFRKRSRLFEFTLDTPPPPNVDIRDDVELPTVGESIADGYYVRVRHLSVGDHVIEFSGTLGPDSLFAGFTLSGKWNITVVDNHQ